MKQCASCKEILENVFFYKNKRKQDGLATYCKSCSKKYQNLHYKKKSNYYKLKSKNKKKKISDLLKKIKESFPCKDCGNKYPYYVMDFDHLFDKKYNIADLSAKSSFKLLADELSKCELVCSNCHRIRTHKRLENKGLRDCSSIG